MSTLRSSFGVDRFRPVSCESSPSRGLVIPHFGKRRMKGRFASCRRFCGYAALLMLFACLASLPGHAQTCTDPGAYCEGWARDSSHREVSLTRTTICTLVPGCAAQCSTAPITALPSVRIGNLDHIVLGFTVPDACVPECAGAPPEPCFNLGISYRRRVGSSSEAVTGVSDCDPTDPGTTVSSGAAFNATYLTGGTDVINISNIVYGAVPPPDNCGAAPTSLDLSASGPSLGVQSHFTFTWTGPTVTTQQVTAYTEVRTYFNLPPPNTVHITVSNINYGAGTYTVSAADASVPTLRSSWGALKVRYR